ncbi:STM3941 family protein [Flavobacterium sp. W20_MBD1_R3]|uniref:STM3941 family protein n=1 Tax=Flavobacterium sp. W20_MBD1_R3 TaxID=3240278 RepID=UPI003F9204DA
MSEENQIEIPLSKQKMYLMLFGSIIFVVIGTWLVVNPPKSNHSIFGNPMVILISGISAIIFFGYTTFILLKKLPDNKPGLIINSEGIIDNSSGVAAGIVLWTDIIEISTANVMNQKFLMFIVKNPEEYINRQNGIVKRKAMEINYKTYGSPISISANTLNTNFEELYKLLKRKFKEST